MARERGTVHQYDRADRCAREEGLASGRRQHLPGLERLHGIERCG